MKIPFLKAVTFAPGYQAFLAEFPPPTESEFASASTIIDAFIVELMESGLSEEECYLLIATFLTAVMFRKVKALKQ